MRKLAFLRTNVKKDERGMRFVILEGEQRPIGSIIVRQDMIVICHPGQGDRLFTNVFSYIVMPDFVPASIVLWDKH